MSKFVILVISFFFSLSLVSANADRLYKWVDDSGRVSYHDRPPPEGSNYRVEKKVFKTGPGNDPREQAIREAARKHPVALYSAPVCASCDLARSYLQSKKIPFTEKDVKNNLEYNKELENLIGELAIPVITVGNKIIKGYVQDWLENELITAGYLKAQTSEARSSR